MVESRYFPVILIHEPADRKIFHWREDDSLTPREKRLIEVWRRSSQKGEGPFWLNGVTERMGVEVFNVSDPNGSEIEIASRFLVNKQ
jgi:hypothetical protein